MADCQRLADTRNDAHLWIQKRLTCRTSQTKSRRTVLSDLGTGAVTGCARRRSLWDLYLFDGRGRLRLTPCLDGAHFRSRSCIGSDDVRTPGHGHGRGLVGVIRRRYSKWVLWGAGSSDCRERSGHCRRSGGNVHYVATIKTNTRPTGPTWNRAANDAGESAPGDMPRRRTSSEPIP